MEVRNGLGATIIARRDVELIEASETEFVGRVAIAPSILLLYGRRYQIGKLL